MKNILSFLVNNVPIRGNAVDVLVQVKSGQVSGGGGGKYFLFLFFLEVYPHDIFCSRCALPAYAVHSRQDLTKKLILRSVDSVRPWHLQNHAK